MISPLDRLPNVILGIKVPLIRRPVNFVITYRRTPALRAPGNNRLRHYLLKTFRGEPYLVQRSVGIQAVFKPYPYDEYDECATAVEVNMRFFTLDGHLETDEARLAEAFAVAEEGLMSLKRQIIVSVL